MSTQRDPSSSKLPVMTSTEAFPSPLSTHPLMSLLTPTFSHPPPHTSPPTAAAPEPEISSFEKGLIKATGVFTQLFPLWCILAAASGMYHPPLYTWFDTGMISNGLMFIMVRWRGGGGKTG